MKHLTLYRWATVLATSGTTICCVWGILELQLDLGQAIALGVASALPVAVVWVAGINIEFAVLSRREHQSETKALTTITESLGHKIQ